MIVQMNSNIFNQLKIKWETSYPNEGCGLLLGDLVTDHSIIINEFVPVNNVAQDPLHHFELDPNIWVRHLMTSKNLIGLFHTHPHSTPIPSSQDIHDLQSYGQLIHVYFIAGLNPKSNTVELKTYEVIKINQEYTLHPATLSLT